MSEVLQCRTCGGEVHVLRGTERVDFRRDRCGRKCWATWWNDGQKWEIPGWLEAMTIVEASGE